MDLTVCGRGMSNGAIMRSILGAGALMCAVIGTLMVCDVAWDLVISFLDTGVSFQKWLSFLFEDRWHFLAVPIGLFLMIIPFIPSLVLVRGSKIKVSLFLIAVLEMGIIAWVAVDIWLVFFNHPAVRGGSI
jgi:hypothetical protein